MKNKEIKSKLQQKNLYFKKIAFNRQNKMPEEIKEDFDVRYEYIDENTIIVDLIVKIKSKRDMSLEVVLTGEYVLEDSSNELSIDEKKIILERNTVAIMFPFMRSEITLVTAQPNMVTVNLPPLNINALIDNIKEKKTK